jgi:FtsP/CotA-like multicopper oxidase with cupredoxin domain
MADMGMDHSAMDDAAGAHGQMDHGAHAGGSGTLTMDHSRMTDHGVTMGHAAKGHLGMGHFSSSQGVAIAADSDGMQPLAHGPDRHGPGNAMIAAVARSRLTEPGIGLDSAPGHKVLLYSDLRSLKPGYDAREPSREIVLHLTGNMERFMWSFDGKKFSEAEPIRLQYGERVRFTLVNDTMMNHPLHLHGLWSELVNGGGARQPRKHVINVKPGERISFDVTADAPGEWPFHCHLLYHMQAGMFRIVAVSANDQAQPEHRH